MVQVDDPGTALSREAYAAIAAFRLELRRFLVFSEAAAGKVGLPAQQHQALLAIAGHDGPPTVGFVAEQLLVAPQTAAELVARMVEAGLLTKAAAVQDRRRMALTLTLKAEALLQRLTAAHLEELRTLEPALTRALGRMRRRHVGACGQTRGCVGRQNPRRGTPLSPASTGASPMPNPPNTEDQAATEYDAHRAAREAAKPADPDAGKIEGKDPVRDAERQPDNPDAAAKDGLA